MTYCAKISDKFGYCQFVNNDPKAWGFFYTCRMLFLCNRMLLNMYFTSK